MDELYERPTSGVVVYRGVPNSDTISIWRQIYQDELGWVHCVDDGFVFDRYHDDCLHLLAYVEGVAAGALRIVFPHNGRLPAEEKTHFATTLRPCRAKAEITRLMVVDRFRKLPFPNYPNGIFQKMMESAIGLCRSSALHKIAMDVRVPNTEHSIFNSVLQFGFRPTDIIYADPLGAQYPPCTTVILDLTSCARTKLTTPIQDRCPRPGGVGQDAFRLDYGDMQ